MPVAVLPLALLVATAARATGPFGLAAAPPMGWRSWNAYHADVSQAKLTAAMDIMATKRPMTALDGSAAEASLVDLGFVHFGLDDAWQACGTGINISGRASYYSVDGEPLINKTCVSFAAARQRNLRLKCCCCLHRKFPDMAAMVAHGTAAGLRVGWYLNNCICGIYDYGDPALEERAYRGSVAAITKYNFSGVKLDSCGGLHNTSKWAELLAATGRDVLIENCNNDCIPGGLDPCVLKKPSPFRYPLCLSASALRCEQGLAQGTLQRSLQSGGR
jgi:alpha-galactosidase